MCTANLSPQQQTNIGMATSILGGIGQYRNIQQQGQDMSNYYSYLANQQSAQAMSDMKTGSIQASNYSRQAGEFRAAQQATMAANGVSGDSASAQDVISDTAAKQKLDEDTILYNANMRAYTANNQANVYRSAAVNATQAANSRALGSLIGTAGSVSDIWGKWKQTSMGQSPNTTPTYLDNKAFPGVDFLNKYGQYGMPNTDWLNKNKYSFKTNYWG